MTNSETKAPAAPADPNTRPLPRIPYPIVLEGQPALVSGANSGIPLLQAHLIKWCISL
jgi:hypothetical protein